MKLSAPFLLTVLLAGSSGPAEAQSTPSPLEGTSWRLLTAPGIDDGALSDVQRPVRVRFDGDRVSGSSGCNHFTSTYMSEGERVTLAPLSVTMMACVEPAMMVEQAFRQAFTGAMTVALAGDRLTLTSSSGGTLVFEREPGPTLEGTTWTITGFNTGRQAVVSPITGTMLTIRFKDGTVSGKSGCSDYRGTYSLTGNTMALTLDSSRKACTNEGVTEQEQQVLAAIQSAVAWTIRDGLLDLVRADGARALTAHPQVR